MITGDPLLCALSALGKMKLCSTVSASPQPNVTAQGGGDHRLGFFTHVASAQMFLCPQKGRRTVAKALPWLNISVTWEGR